MKRAEQIFEELQSILTNGQLGPSGSYFYTVRELAAAYSCSLHCALDVFQKLTDVCLIRSIGKRCCITTGPCAANTPFAQYLSQNTRNIFGILLHDSSNPFFGSLLNHLHSIAAQQNYELIAASTNSDPQRTKTILDLFLSLNCKGVFNCTTITREQEPFFSRYPLPLVTLAEDSKLPNIDTVLVNNFSAGKHVARHLIRSGCKSFAYVTEANYLESDQRLQGFRHQLSQAGFLLPNNHIGIISTLQKKGINTREASWFVTNLLNQLRQKQTPLPIGIFCVHDLLAVEVLRAVKHGQSAKHERLTIPKDVMIVGFDDLPIASMITPTLTTVSYQYSSLAKTAFQIMIDYVENPEHRCQSYEVNSSLTIRETTVSQETVNK
ncbi:MAG: LacI family transcriptional regulator [Ruminococcaceae bacterium]|nr:LacI family transcriptional regulator [Oscillospiraceae bacterium]